MGRLAICAFALLAIACVDSGDAGDAAAQGALGGPCFANNTCNGALTCVLVNGKGVCQESDATVEDAPADQKSEAASGDASQDVAPVDAGCDSGFTPQPVCAGNCNGELCCELTGQCINFGCSQNCTGGICWACSRASLECSTNMYCCASGGALQGTCPPTATTPNGANCTGATACTSGFFICATNADCPPSAPTCVPAKATGLSVTAIGYCQ